MKYTKKSDLKTAGLGGDGRLIAAVRSTVRRTVGPKKDMQVMRAIEKHWHLRSIGFVERAAAQIEKIKDAMSFNEKGAHLVSAQEMAEINEMPEEERMDAIESYSELRKAIIKADVFGGQSLDRFHNTPYLPGNVCIYVTRKKITSMESAVGNVIINTKKAPFRPTEIWYEDSNDLIDSMLISSASSYATLKNKWTKFVMEMTTEFRLNTNIIVQCPASTTNFIAEECAAIACQFFVLETDGKIYRPAYAMTDILRTIDEPTSNIKLKLMSLSVGKRIIWPVKDEDMADKISAKMRPIVEMITSRGYKMEFQYGRFLVDGNLYYLIVKTADTTPKPSGTVTV